ncbi:MAG: hypothetical protein M1840_002006 [Geoglossum simile]|nr:MAG: hypothetical protein M1840_002006 [Geoglossum simile]
MALSKSEIIKSKPIGGGLNNFYDLYNTTRTDIPKLSDAVGHMHIDDEGLNNLIINLILALQSLPVARLLPSPNGHRTLSSHLSRFYSAVNSDNFDLRSTIPLLTKVFNKAPDADIWDAVYDLVTKSTPPPCPLPYPNRTPILFNTGSLANTYEYRKHFDGAMKDELNLSLYIDIPNFFDTFFGGLINLELVAGAVFKKCQEDENPLYKKEEGEQIDMFLKFAKECSTTRRKLDGSFTNNTQINESSRYYWSQILIPGELKSNPNIDRHNDTWLDLAKYARHVLTAQETRQFVLDFTLCGSIMQLWEFDRLGSIASSPFDINKEGLQFVSAILGYLWINKEQLGFDPIIFELDGKHYMEITRNGRTEQLIFVELMKQHLSSFLINLDLAIKENQEKPSGALSKTGTRAFIAIGALYSEEHSFMHDLESSFWVLFWICIHYNEPNKKSQVVPKFEKLNYEEMEELAKLKKGMVDHEGDFIKTVKENFTSYY